MDALVKTLDCGVLGELDCDIGFDFSMGRPGKYYGPWEDSYPDEPDEIYIRYVKYGPYDFTSLCDLDIIADLIAEDAREAAHEAIEDARLARWEARREEEDVF